MLLVHDRERTRKTEGTQVFYIQSVGTFYAPSILCWSLMKDSYRNYRPGITRAMEKYSITVEPVFADYGIDSLGRHVTISGGAMVPGWVGVDDMLARASVPDDSQWEWFGEQAYNDLAVQIDTDLLVFASLYEMREIGELAQQVLDLTARLAQKARALRDARSGLSKKEFLSALSDGTLKTASSAYLGYKFGIAPTVQDVRALLNLSTNLSSQINRLKEMNGKLTRRQVSKSPNLAVAPAVPLWTYLGPRNGIGRDGLRLRHVGGSDRFSASCYIQAALDGLDSVDGWARALITKVGLANPLETMWELASNSWIADMFVGVGTRLRRLSIDYLRPYKGQWDLTRQSCSYKATKRYEVQYLPGGSPSAGWQTVCFVDVDSFVRLPYLPCSASLSMRSNPSSGQLLLLGALLGSR